MTFDVEQIDSVLRTTRAVRRRLDLDRPVSDEIILQCIDLAEQAPSGANIASRRWLVIRDAEVKAQVAELYRMAGGANIIQMAEQL
ncbi:MAG: nitroreductase family protein, partial [Candidatus Tectomicrobia bacterium]|nr:nitroreductase family protein [Candidatus Tectomicrobia bacterium]